MTNEIWKRGSMTFTSIWSKPPRMKMWDWCKAEKDIPRKWVSKAGEVPSQFIMRIVRDMENEGANISGYLYNEIMKADAED